MWKVLLAPEAQGHLNALFAEATAQGGGQLNQNAPPSAAPPAPAAAPTGETREQLEARAAVGDQDAKAQLFDLMSTDQTNAEAIRQARDGEVRRARVDFIRDAPDLTDVQRGQLLTAAHQGKDVYRAYADLVRGTAGAPGQPATPPQTSEQVAAGNTAAAAANSAPVAPQIPGGQAPADSGHGIDWSADTQEKSAADVMKDFFDRSAPK